MTSFSEPRTMKTGLALRLQATLLAAVLLLAACSSSPTIRNSEQHQPNTPPVVEPVVPEIDRPGQRETLIEGQRRLGIDYAVRLDQRFIKAMAKVAELTTGDRSMISAQFDGKVWHLRQGPQEIGTLPAYPDFNQSFACLLGWSHRLVVAANWVEPKSSENKGNSAKEFEQFSPSGLFKTLRQCNDSWRSGDRSAAVLKRAARALVMLNEQRLDLFEQGDELPAEALAMVALSSAVDDDSMNEERCWLCYSMNYVYDGRLLSKELQKTNPLRLAIWGDVAGLSKQAQNAQASQEVRYLYLRTLGLQGLGTAWRQFAMTKADEPDLCLPVLRTFYSLAGEESRSALGNYLLAETIKEVENKGVAVHTLNVSKLTWTFATYRESLDWVMPGLVNSFEQQQKKLDCVGDGPLISDDVARAYYYSNFASGIYLLSKAFMTEIATKGDRDRFAYALEADAGSRLASFKRWFNDMYAVKEGTMHYREIGSETAAVGSLGICAIVYLWLEAGPSNRTEDLIEIPNCAKALQPYVDSRPEYRRGLATVLEQSFFDFSAAHELFDAAQTDSVTSTVDDRIKFLASVPNYPALKSLLQQGELGKNESVMVLHYLAGSGKQFDALVIAHYRLLLQKYPVDWDLMHSYLLFLTEHRKSEEAVQALRNWMAASKVKFAEDREAKWRLAHALFDLQRWDECLRALGNDPEPGAPEELVVRALALQHLGRGKEAKAWAIAALDRYPESKKVLTMVAEVFWLNHEFDRAAYLLSLHSAVLTPQDWRNSVGLRFVRTFGGDAQLAKRAIYSLKERRLVSPETLSQIAAATFLNDRPQISFETITSIDQVTPRQAFDLAVLAYKYLKRWKGKKEALSWLKEQIPENERIHTAQYAFVTRQTELLWEFIEQVPANSEGDYLWLLRAAAFLYDADNDQKQLSALHAYFKTGKSFDRAIGRYLLSLDDGDALRSLKLDRAQLCRSAFFVGWKAFLKPRRFYEDASWYRLAIDTGATETPELIWSARWLGDIQRMLENDRQNMHHESVLVRLGVRKNKTDPEHGAKKMEVIYQDSQNLYLDQTESKK